jgi:hypothetical protein
MNTLTIEAIQSMYSMLAIVSVVLWLSLTAFVVAVINDLTRAA